MSEPDHFTITEAAETLGISDKRLVALVEGGQADRPRRRAALPRDPQGRRDGAAPGPAGRRSRMSAIVDTIRVRAMTGDSAEFTGLAGAQPVWFTRTRGAEETAAMVRRILASGFTAGPTNLDGTPGTTFTRGGCGMSDYCPIASASRDLEVSFRRVFELAASGVIRIVVAGNGVGVSKADVAALSWPPVEGDAA
jgi:hypothetical protein